MKTHAQPWRPPTPSMWIIAAARRPENAEAIEVAENMTETLRGASQLSTSRRQVSHIPQLQQSSGIESGEIESYTRQKTTCESHQRQHQCQICQ